MQESTAWTLGILVGLPLLAASAGATLIASGLAFGNIEFAALLFLAVFLAAGLALQVYRRDLGRPTYLAAGASALAVFAFFAAALWVGAGEGGVDARAAWLLLLAAPLAAGGIAGAGALVLARGVDAYRQEHGRIHAPR